MDQSPDVFLPVQLCRFADDRWDWRSRLSGKLRRQRGAGNRCEIHADGVRRPFYYRKLDSDAGVLRQIYRKREYDLTRMRCYGEMADLLRRERGGGRRPLVVDAGANIGASTVYFALSLPGSRIIAVEPEPENFALLQRNTNGLDVHCLPAALAGRAGRVRVVDAGEGSWGFQTAPSSDLEAVPCVTVSELLERYGEGCFPFVVKIDIEGGERDVFAGDTEWIGRTPVLVIELHDWLSRRGERAPFSAGGGRIGPRFCADGRKYFFSAQSAVAARGAQRGGAVRVLGGRPRSPPGGWAAMGGWLCSQLPAPASAEAGPA